MWEEEETNEAMELMKHGYSINTAVRIIGDGTARRKTIVGLWILEAYKPPRSFVYGYSSHCLIVSRPAGLLGLHPRSPSQASFDVDDGIDATYIPRLVNHGS